MAAAAAGLEAKAAAGSSSARPWHRRSIILLNTHTHTHTHTLTHSLTLTHTHTHLRKHIHTHTHTHSHTHTHTQVDRLVEMPHGLFRADGHGRAHRHAARASGMGGMASVGDGVSHAKEAFRNFEQEASSLGTAGGAEPEDRAAAASGSAGGAASALKKPRNLADIYRPPLEICFRGTLDELRATGIEQGRYTPRRLTAAHRVNL
ncbi:hypothetical protein T492DRAFT_381890 [Pavlovales sp. CCMP2436]|nr:hypothetical protein T492DRAFT_381890 [Pavlovales sp. CCMP2436]